MSSPTARADPGMLAAAVAFTAATAYGSAVSIRLDLDGEPFGIRVPLPVPAAVALGWGAALSAPWPMPAAAVVRTYRTQPTPVRVATASNALAVTALIASGLRQAQSRPQVARCPSRRWLSRS